MRTKEQLAREKLSPFLESAFSQLLAELPKTRSGYDLCKRIESRVTERRKQIWTRKSRPSKGRKRSVKERADRASWWDAKQSGKTVYKAATVIEPGHPEYQAEGGQEEHEWKSLAEYEAWIHQPAAAKAPTAPPTPVKTQAQLDYEANVRMCAEQDREREAKRLGVDIDDLD